MTSVASSAQDSASHPLSLEELYDDIAPDYDKAYAGVPIQTDSIEWVITQLEQAQIKPAKILDVGSGTGRPVCADFVAAGHDVLGIDISSAMIEAARQRVPQAKFEQIDARDFSAPPATFDAITVYWSLIVCFSQDEIRQSIRKIHDWLKPGGIFVFVTAASFPGNNVLTHWLGRPMIASTLPSQEAADWIRKVGFEVVYDAVVKHTPIKAAEVGLCAPEDVYEEDYQVVYAKKRSTS
ncbi:MAG: hypothetical protein M1816_002065 [Peltula sp. TS41687]|nr:MAG: hypothetical protein M1816_002065 [Peltula sp. TS41687]